MFDEACSVFRCQKDVKMTIFQEVRCQSKTAGQRLAESRSEVGFCFPLILYIQKRGAKRHPRNRKEGNEKNLPESREAL